MCKPRFNPHPIAPVLALILVLLGTGSAWAQCNVEAEAERVRAQIERVREVVVASDVAEARRLLQAAFERLQEAARLARERKRERACAQLAAARSLAEKALQIALQADQLQQRLEQDLARIADLLEEISGIVRECRAAEAERMLEAARRQLAKAWVEYNERNFRAAYAFSRTAENQGRRARLFCTVDSIDPGRLKDELERTDELLVETESRLVDRGLDTGDLLPARELQQQAWEHFHNERFVASYALTRRARDLARSAVGRMARSVAPGEIQTLIGSTRELIDRLAGRAEEAEADQARRLLAQADRLLDRAQSDLDAGRLRKAVAAARAASALAQDVAEMLEEAPK